jgi:hypothetical protein
MNGDFVSFLNFFVTARLILLPKILRNFWYSSLLTSQPSNSFSIHPGKRWDSKLLHTTAPTLYVYFPLLMTVFLFGSKRDEVTGEWRKLHNEELNGLYSLPDIVRVTKV